MNPKRDCNQISVKKEKKDGEKMKVSKPKKGFEKERKDYSAAFAAAIASA